MPTNEFAGGRLNSYTNHVRNICHINGALRCVCVCVCLCICVFGEQSVWNWVCLQLLIDTSLCHVETLCDFGCISSAVWWWSMCSINFRTFHFLIFVASSELPAALSILLFCSYIEFKIVWFWFRAAQVVIENFEFTQIISVFLFLFDFLVVVNRLFSLFRKKMFISVVLVLF